MFAQDNRIWINSLNLRCRFESGPHDSISQRYLITRWNSRILWTLNSSSFPLSLPFLRITHFREFHQFLSERDRACWLFEFSCVPTREPISIGPSFSPGLVSVTLQFFFSLSLSLLVYLDSPRNYCSLSPLISAKGRRSEKDADHRCTIHTGCIAVRSLSLSVYLCLSLLPSVRASFTFCRGSLGNGAPAILPLKRADDDGAAQFRLSSSHYCPSPFTLRSPPTAMRVSSSRLFLLQHPPPSSLCSRGIN